MWDQISIPSGEGQPHLLDVFQITHPNWKEGVRDRFQKYFTYYPPVKDKETKVLTKSLQGKEPNILSPVLDFLDHHGPWWAGLSCPTRLQVARAERAELSLGISWQCSRCKQPLFYRDFLCLGLSHVPPAFSLLEHFPGSQEALVVGTLTEGGCHTICQQCPRCESQGIW